MRLKIFSEFILSVFCNAQAKFVKKNRMLYLVKSVFFRREILPQFFKLGKLENALFIGRARHIHSSPMNLVTYFYLQLIRIR